MVVSSGDEEKCKILIDKIMDARIKQVNTQGLFGSNNGEHSADTSNSVSVSVSCFQVKEGTEIGKK